jgi:lipopolysaccharide transport system ATP-binding protein
VSSPVITVERLGKRYRIGVTQRRAATFGEAIRRVVGGPFQYLRTRLREATEQETLWALKDVSFEVRQGEVLGIIGRNGAGKSTLLKILSRITDPTEGRAIIRGRVNSLLEVGIGFHRELTGRENIYMNAAMHGMKRAEIKRKLDEIVAFADVEKFLDTPVKFYSSGMYTRLAFAVAAHLDPDILLVDEVLAVGDSSFQKRCLAKMENVSKAGRTVLFVSHNMMAVTSLCSRVVWLQEGRIVADGPSAQIAARYLQSDRGTTAERVWEDLQRAPGNEHVRITRVRVCNQERGLLEVADVRKPVGLEMELCVLKPGKVLTPSYHVVTEEGVFAFITFDLEPSWRRTPRPEGRYRATAWIPGHLLSEGIYSVWANVLTMDPFEVHAHERDAVAFRVTDPCLGDTARGDISGIIPGAVRPLLQWEDERLAT